MLIGISSASQVQGELCFDGPAESSELEGQQGQQSARDPGGLMGPPWTSSTNAAASTPCSRPEVDQDFFIGPSTAGSCAFARRSRPACAAPSPETSRVRGAAEAPPRGGTRAPVRSRSAGREPGGGRSGEARRSERLRVTWARGDGHRAATAGWPGSTAGRPPCPAYRRFSESPPIQLAAA